MILLIFYKEKGSELYNSRQVSNTFIASGSKSCHSSALQWNLGIRDTHGTVKHCPEF